MTIATAGTGGFGGDAAAEGPNAGYDPVMKFRKKLKKKKEKKGYHVMPDGTMMPGETHNEEKDHEVSMAQAQLDKSAENIKKLKKKLGNKEKNIPAWVQAKITDTEHNTDAAAGYTTESAQVPTHTPRTHLYQYKVTIPEVGETVIYAASPAELSRKLRMVIAPQHRANIKLERIMPGEAGKFFMDKRSKHMRNVAEQDEKQMQQQMTQQQIANEKKKVDLKKMEMQKQLQKKIQSLKNKQRVGGAQATVDQ